ncbi:MAG TPA: hypothetical protein ENG74_01800 [Thermoplasmatales archaeon]|nr:hypothetical protein [Thermoplasmatales archaeon]
MLKARKHLILLFIAVVLGITIRSLPAWTNAAWGNDFGIYYGITTSILREQRLFIDYDGWGSSYQYFPTLYILSIMAHLATGIDILWLMPRIAPIVGGLTVLVIYYIVVYLFRDRKLALLSSFLLAIAPFHVYQTSHAAPLTMGHFFMLLCMYYFIRCIKGNRTSMIFLIPLTLLLVLSHHLTTYFYLISVDAIFLVSLVWKRRTEKNDYLLMCYVLFASLTTFGYWALVAKPVFYNFIPSGFPLVPYQTITLYFALLIGGFLLVTKSETTREKLFKLITRPSKSGYKSKIVLSFILILSIESFFMLIPLPGVMVKINALTIIYSIPIALLFSFGVAGLTLLKKTGEGLIVRWWFISIFMSFVYSIVYRETSIYPDRHIEYLVVPLSIAAAISLNRYLHDVRPLPISLPSLSRTRSAIGVTLVISIILSNMIVVYPAFDSINAADERITECCMSAIEWLKENINDSSVIASDHRLSMLLWANGFSTVSEETNLTWTAKSWDDCKDELKLLNVSYILLDDIMKEKIVNVGVGKYYEINNESYEKFGREPFELVYRNATYDSEGNEIRWAEIYFINWSCIHGEHKG